MNTIHTLVIGAGQAGLAVSRCLTDAGIDHVVLERGRTAQRWLGQRWESLRLLSPNWATRLPGWTYQGEDPSGYMTAAELAAYLTAYAGSFDAPIAEGQDVRTVRRVEHGFVVHTSDATWAAGSVVVATGWCDRPRVPGRAARLDPAVVQITPDEYRNPAQLPQGRVLVVGAAATGVQIADELARAGREVVLAVGRHSRVPRRYRGMDIWWWLDRIGTFAATIDGERDPIQSRDHGALQLVGRDDHRDVDLPALQALGVRLTGRLRGIDGADLTFADDLEGTTTAADERLGRLLGRIDDHIAATGLEHEVLPAVAPTALRHAEPTARLRASRDRIATVVWATGYRRHYPWLQVPVLGATGDIVHRRGVTPAAGLYVVGQRFQHRRDSNFIDGVRHDATFVARHIAGRLRDHARAPSLSREDR